MSVYSLFRFFMVLLAVNLSSQLKAQPTGTLSGFVLNATNQQVLQGATILVSPLGITTVTDSAGQYRINGIPVGAYQVTVSYIGFEEEKRYNVVITTGNVMELSFELQPSPTSLSEVVIRSSRNTARASSAETPLSVQRLTAEEIRANPGGNFDVSRVVNSLPGVGGSSGSVGGYRNDIIIRGGGPGENVFYLDGIELPVINHFATQGSGGGPTGILNLAFIEEVKLSTSAFHARYDNALSSVFEFKQKSGNTRATQGNVRLSGTELAGTVEGPLHKNGDLTYLASVRRSYLQLLFSLLDLPIRPNFWDYQFKLSYRASKKTTIQLLGIGAIDQFGFGSIKEPDQEKLYTLNQVPSIRQKSYAFGMSLRRSLGNGYYLVSVSRNALDNRLEKFDFNDDSDISNLRFRTNAKETENKLRFELNKSSRGWNHSFGGMAQYLEYDVFNNIRRRAAIGTQPEERFLFSSDINFARFGAFLQTSRKFFGDRLSLSLGLRTDVNTITNDGTDPLQAFSPRVALSYVLSDHWKLNATAGRYARIAPYTILGFRDNNGQLVNLDNDYITNMHYVTGVEYLPRATTRFTLETFYKKYDHVPVTINDGININNQGADFGIVGNEPVMPVGRGEAYGIEFFAQQKLTKKFFGMLSYTFFYSRFSNRDQKMVASSWDNRHLLSLNLGYKLGKNWELGLKYRYQGGAPYTPIDLVESQRNFLTQGQGLLDYTQINTKRLRAFSASDIRIDKKWNIRNFSFDLFLDVSNWWAAKNVSYPKFTLKQDVATGAYLTTDGQPIRQDGSNGIPLILVEDEATVLPTIGFIIEF